MLKAGDIVLNKKTNMVGRVATVDAQCNQARCEHDDRSAAYPLELLEPYTGKTPPGTELDAKADVAAEPAADEPHAKKSSSWFPKKGDK
jgi:hypothetical protein